MPSDLMTGRCTRSMGMIDDLPDPAIPAGIVTQLQKNRKIS
jgi:hypothetical protein